jgi:hypothetical protein
MVTTLMTTKIFVVVVVVVVKIRGQLNKKSERTALTIIDFLKYAY